MEGVSEAVHNVMCDVIERIGGMYKKGPIKTADRIIRKASPA